MKNENEKLQEALLVRIYIDDTKLFLLADGCTVNHFLLFFIKKRKRKVGFIKR